MFRILAKPAIPGNITVPIFENEDRCFIDFDCDVGVRGVRGGGVVDIGFFTRTDATVDGVEETAVDEFEEDHAGAGVEDLF